MRILLVLCFLFCSSLARAKLEIPTGLNQVERRSLLEVLGFGSAPTLQSDPYPLGGYSGYEIGLSNIIIPTTDVSRLGSRPDLQGETSYAQLSFAKGLYYNFDLFLQFTPMGQVEQISSFGGGLKWGFYEAEYMPLSLSFVGAANSTSFQNRINISALSLDLLMGFNIDDVSLYFGAGQVRASGVFVGGASGVTDSSNTESETVSEIRVLGGLVLKFSKFFLGLEIDRVSQPSYALKIGFRN